MIMFTTCFSGEYQCGPAPVNAIKAGDVYLGYDTKFLFSEVNGDKLIWQHGHCGEDILLSHHPITSAVGRFISTKAVGCNEREDITEHYKYKEGTYYIDRTRKSEN